MLERGAGAWPRLALVTADTAAEAILGLIAAEGTTGVAEGAHFDDVYAAAIASLRDRDVALSPGLRSRIRQTHRLRNMALHHGSEPGSRAVARAVEGVQQLRDVAVSGSPILQAFRASGPTLAVAELVGVAAIANPLRRAAAALQDEALVEAADATSIALDQTLRVVTPSLRPSRSPFLISDQLRRIGLGGSIENVHKETERRADAIEAWVLALGIGLQPAELAELQRLLGRPISPMRGNTTVRRRDDVVLTSSSVEAALLKTTDVVFRLWLTDALRRDEPDDRNPAAVQRRILERDG